ncbi:cytochrome P450 alkane hydroxylase [Scheffersomyces xylosifermentans]|uniref:cytochrome P450 alkane hydroxylase n=1 Tax=Scheffersomyces xylosifermentans TaxID=1304137 RepID=UPI00315DD435
MPAIEDLIPYLAKWYTIVAGAVVVYALATYAKRSSFKKAHGCKDAVFLKNSWWSIPLILELLKKKNEGDMVDFAIELFHRAKANTYYISLVGVNIFLSQDPEVIKALLATQFNDFALGTRHAHFKPLLGDGIFTLDGEGWKHSRAMLRPQFAREQVAHVQSLEPHLQVFRKHIDKADGKTIDIQELFFKLTVDTSTEFLFGESVCSLYDESIGLPPPNDIDGRAEFAESFNVAQKYAATRSYVQMFYWLINNAEFRKANAGVHKVAKHYVQRALNFTPEELEKNSANGYTFLYELVKQTRNPKVLQDQLLNILVAGRDTTAGLLSFTFFELARRPEVLAKLKEEIYLHFGKGDDAKVDEITFASLKKCEYLKFVLNETLRLYPSVPINFRVSNKDTTLPVGGGEDGQAPIFIPKGTTVAYSVYATHRMEEYYGKDASEFKPERWADSKRLSWAYVPFNGGPRICLGQQFALTEASYVVVRLLQMFPNLVSKDSRPYPPKKSVHLTMCHQDAVYVQLTK